MSEQENNSADGNDENKLIAQRREKLSELRQQGQAFPNSFKRLHDASNLVAEFADKSKDELEKISMQVVLAGRIIRMRGPFVVIQDGSDQIQLYLNFPTK